MFVLAHLIRSVALLLDMVIGILWVLLAIRIILSWFAANPYNELVQVLNRVTDPLLAPFRRLPLQVGMIDFSPVLAFLVLYFIRVFVVGLLNGWALRLGGL